MRVQCIEEPAGTQVRVEFMRTNESVSDFKTAIWDWVQVNHPSWTLTTFFQRLIFFNDSSCIIDTS